MIVEIPAEISRHLEPPFSGIYEELKRKLDNIEKLCQDSIGFAAQGIVVCADSLDELKRYIAIHPFESQELEIIFFKYVKPRFLAQWLFYRYLYVLEVNRPANGTCQERKYLKRKYRIVCASLDDHRDLYAYLKSGFEYNDNSFFLRQNKCSPLSSCYPYCDNSFTTARDEELAKIMRNIMIQLFLEDAIKRITRNNSKQPQTALKWTATLAGLYELIYSLRRSGAINNGNVTISELADFFEVHFQVDLRNIYRGRQEGRIKKNRSAFLKKLVSANEEAMNETDENGSGLLR